ncbi:MAG: hypothetical protein K2M57_10130 [Paramuribaculum sp.]|nr:hypothetical protein [Paramuribaculum sp.]
MTAKMVTTAAELEAEVGKAGLLPFFAFGAGVKSVEELVAPGMLFADDEGGLGAWDWKGPVVRNMECTYGKFFRRKAGFVALPLLTHFLNYRRDLFRNTIEDTDIKILKMVKENESMMTAEIRKEMYGTSIRKGHSVETYLTRLQMSGYLIIADFEQSISKQGEPYGWGKARYTTPEALFGYEIAKTGCDGQKSFEWLFKEMCKRQPQASSRMLAKLIG